MNHLSKGKQKLDLRDFFRKVSCRYFSKNTQLFAVYFRFFAPFSPCLSIKDR